MKTRRYHCIPQHGSVSANIHNTDIENNLAPGNERYISPYLGNDNKIMIICFYEHLIYKCTYTLILKGTCYRWRN